MRNTSIKALTASCNGLAEDIRVTCREVDSPIGRLTIHATVTNHEDVAWVTKTLANAVGRPVPNVVVTYKKASKEA